MRREKAWTVGVVSAQRLLAFERVKKRGEGRRIPARVGRQGDAALIGVTLLVAAVRCQDESRRELSRAADDAAERGADHAEDSRRNPEQQREWRRGAGPAGGVPLQHVRHLVPEHASELVLAVEERQQPARDVDVAAGKREGVRLGVVGHVELPRDVAALRRLRDPAGHLPNIAHEIRVADEANRPLDLFSALLAELALFAGRDGGATAREHGKGRDEPAAEPPACDFDWR
jgi:hypothetical protein